VYSVQVIKNHPFFSVLSVFRVKKHTLFLVFLHEHGSNTLIASGPAGQGTMSKLLLLLKLLVFMLCGLVPVHHVSPGQSTYKVILRFIAPNTVEPQN
jgi:hypothetical protein